MSNETSDRGLGAFDHCRFRMGTLWKMIGSCLQHENMHYHLKHQITNANQTIADKVNYFADCFYFTVNNFGYPGFPELENHVSLLEKILYQLKHSSAKSPLPIINRYADNQLLSSKDLIIKSHHLPTWKSFNEAKIALNREGWENFQARQVFEAATYKLHVELSEFLLKNALDYFIHFLHCKYELQRHGHIRLLDYITPIIAAEFVLNRFRKRFLHQIFDKILENDVVFEDKDPYTPFSEEILPKAIFELRHTHGTNSLEYTDAVLTYLRNRTLADQFNGLYHIFVNSRTEITFLFKIKYIKLGSSVHVPYHNVLFSTSLKEEYISENSNPKYTEFFNNSTQVYAQVTVLENDDITGFEKAIIEVEDALKYFNAILRTRARISTTDDYIIKYRGKNIRHHKYPNDRTIEDPNDLLIHNPFILLKDNPSELVLRFLQIDRIFIDALNSQRKEDKLIKLWQYLECFFANADEVQNYVSQVASKGSWTDGFVRHNDLVYQVLDEAYFRSTELAHKLENDLGLSQEYIRHLMNKRDVDNPSIYTGLNHPYIRKRLEQFNRLTKSGYANISQPYYYSVLLEAYEQRNMIIHAGVSTPSSIVRVISPLAGIVRDFRLEILQELRRTTHVRFRDVINSILQNA